MTIAELANLMGQTESDVNGFINCLAIWIRKGYSLEEAIERNMRQMTRLAENSHRWSRELAKDEMFVGELYDGLRAQA